MSAASPTVSARPAHGPRRSHASYGRAVVLGQHHVQQFKGHTRVSPLPPPSSKVPMTPNHAKACSQPGWGIWAASRTANDAVLHPLSAPLETAEAHPDTPFGRCFWIGTFSGLLPTASAAFARQDKPNGPRRLRPPSRTSTRPAARAWRPWPARSAHRSRVRALGPRQYGDSPASSPHQ